VPLLGEQKEADRSVFFGGKEMSSRVVKSNRVVKSTLEWKHSRPGWTGSEQPDLVSGVPARCGGVGLDDL